MDSRGLRRRLASGLAAGAALLATGAGGAELQGSDRYVVLHLPAGIPTQMPDEVLGGDLTLSNRPEKGGPATWVLAEWPRNPKTVGVDKAVVITTTYKVDCDFGTPNQVTRLQVESWAGAGFKLDTQTLSEPPVAADMTKMRNIPDLVWMLGCAQSWPKAWGYDAGTFQATLAAARSHFASGHW